MFRKVLTLVCIATLTFGYSLVASAEVQNVKVGGEIEIEGHWEELTPTVGDKITQDYVEQDDVEIFVDSHLTDNVRGYVQLQADHWDWGNFAGTGGPGGVEIEYAFLTLEEIYGYPVSLTIGREELDYSNGFLVSDDFDDFRFQWDIDPVTIDFFVAKIAEGYFQNTDQDFYGINWNYDGGMYGNWDFAFLHDTNQPAAGDGRNTVSAFSIFGEGDIPQITTGTLTLEGQIVKEWGEAAEFSTPVNAGPNAVARNEEVDFDAWGGYFCTTYTFDNPYKPYLGFLYGYMSGDKDADKPDSTREDFYDFYEDFEYLENDYFGALADGIVGANTNLKAWRLSGGFNPTENTYIDVSYYTLRAAQDEDFSDDIGREYDVTFGYDYTEDVEFWLLYGYFDGGDRCEDIYGIESARELVGAVEIDF